jgi:hypothetical protein
MLPNIKCFCTSKKIYDQHNFKCAICLEIIKIDFECKTCIEGKYCNQCFNKHINSEYGRYCPCCKSEGEWYKNIVDKKIIIKIENDSEEERNPELTNKILEKKKEIKRIFNFCFNFKIFFKIIIIFFKTLLLLIIFSIISIFIGFLFNPMSSNEEGYLITSFLIGFIIILIVFVCICYNCKINLLGIYICE